MDCRTLDGPSCTIIMTVRDPSPKGLHTLSKCPMTDIDDGPSLLSVITVRDFPSYGLQINILKVRYDGPHDSSSYLRRAVTCFVRVSLLLQRCGDSGRHILDKAVADEDTTEDVQTT